MMKKSIFLLLLFIFSALPVLAAEPIDSDNDGISDGFEKAFYKTNPNDSDTDKDGYLDGDEIAHGYSPISKKQIKMADLDTDNDGLSDWLEIRFSSDLTKKDSDNDKILDGEAVNRGFSPINNKIKLPKKITVNLTKQEVTYTLGTIDINTFRVSTGKRSMPTAKGEYKIINKQKRVWSKRYGLWMPFWMGLKDGSFGFHELPEWPNGYKEGANHLGIPVSHGCIRLGVGPAEKLYNWTDVGTPVTIK